MTRLVFAHYFGGSTRSWVALVDELGAGFDCVVPDVPGFGDTPPPAATSLGAYADWLIDTAGDAPWWAVGHSMGGKIALAAAAKRPPGLAGLILIASAPAFAQPMTDAARAEALDAYANRGRATKQLEDTGSRLPPEVLKVAVDDELRVAEPAWRWWLETGSRDDIAAATAAIDVPVLVLAGDRDEVMGPDVPRAIAAGLPRAELHILSDAGHLLPLERPDAVAERIAAFV